MNEVILRVYFLTKGYASDLYELIKDPIEDTHDDQIYYIKRFLNPQIRKKLNIKLDYDSHIFQNLHETKCKKYFQWEIVHSSSD